MELLRDPLRSTGLHPVSNLNGTELARTLRTSARHSFSTITGTRQGSMGWARVPRMTRGGITEGSLEPMSDAAMPLEPAADDEYLTTTQFAALFGRRQNWGWLRVSKGEIPGYKIHGKVYVTRRDIDEFIRRNRHQPGS